VFLIGLSVAFNCGAQIVLSTYDCPSEIDLKTCSSRCLKRDLELLRILVSGESKAVMLQNVLDRDWEGFKKGAVISSNTLSNCIIFDKSNFDCSSRNDWGLAVTERHEKMTDRVYVSFSKIRTRNVDIGPGGNLIYGPFVSNPEPFSGFCAK
jgi:hypothetical protein